MNYKESSRFRILSYISKLKTVNNYQFERCFSVFRNLDSSSHEKPDLRKVQDAIRVCNQLIIKVL